ncbi:hypothetical protein [Methylobacter sp. BlB1]|uniref:hypothetical protein n=1 Tax=Methylobacter sp. BlB1 TaxID=2785914 RepID=UPI001893868B|nr:hypothetical protein [Methylobacter sp. BlB1]MBF6650441.1 hypothetical protein [Methylobacter sp. BlB1]
MTECNESTSFTFLPFNVGHYVVDGIVFQDVGWAWCSIYNENGSEFVFAIGWRKEGVALDALRKICRNHLFGWSEAKTTFYEQWYAPLDDEMTHCWKVFSISSIPHHDNSLCIRPIKVTIFRHDGWLLDSELKRSCARFKGWYQGNRMRIMKNPLPLMLQSCDLYNLPGYLLYGRIDGTRERLLEWPTHDYQWLKKRASIWSARGATKMCFRKSSLAWDIEDHGWIDQETDALIMRAIEQYGDDFEISDVLRFGIA